jgi:hypothetical protein
MNRDFDLIRQQIMRDVEELQHQFASAQTASLPCVGKQDSMQDRRQDSATALTVTEALRMKTAFGVEAAHRLLTRSSVAADVADRSLAGRYDQRQHSDRRCVVRLELMAVPAIPMAREAGPARASRMGARSSA